MTTATAILEILSDGQMRTTKSLTDRLRKPRSTVSQTLQRMEARRQVRRVERGLWALREWDPETPRFTLRDLSALPPMPVGNADYAEDEECDQTVAMLDALIQQNAKPHP